MLAEATTARGAWSQHEVSEEIVRASVLEAEVFSDILNPDAFRGFTIPFFPSFHLRRAELTVWAGGNGSGKSQLMSQLALCLMMRGEKVCVLSFEMRPQDTISGMLRMCIGRRPSPQDADKCEEVFKTFADNLLIYRNQGAVNADFALDCVLSAIKDHGCSHVFVDNLMMLTSASSSDGLYQSQKRITEDLKTIADQTSAHIHLVAHLRKNRDSVPGEADPLPTRYDISGSADISNLADNVVLINRNFKKEKEILDGGMKTEQWDAKADTVLFLDKQRRTGRMAQQKLWYERTSGQFCLSPDRKLLELAPASVTGVDCLAPHQAENLWPDDIYERSMK